MDFLSKIRFESKVIPGAVVTFRRVTAATRATYLQSLSKARAEIRALQRERKPLDDAYSKAVEAAKAAAKIEVDRLIEAENIDRAEAEKRVPLAIDFPDDQFLELTDSLDRQRQMEKDAMGRATLRAAFVSIEGVTVDGHPPTIDELIEDAPVEFVDELIAAADGIAGLGPQERGESPWPGTSARPTVGPTPDMTANPAESAPEAA